MIRWRFPASAADATRLAADLARLIDDMETEGVPWDAVGGLAPDDHAHYFQVTLDFLEIVVDEMARLPPGNRPRRPGCASRSTDPRRGETAEPGALAIPVR